MRLARLNWPPMSPAASNRVTRWPRSASEAGRPGADHGDGPGARGGRVDQFGFRAGARIHQAARALVLEHVVEAGLVAGDAGVDGRRAPAAGLFHPLRVREQGPRHRDHVGAAGRQHGFGHLGRVDAVGRDQRQADMRLQLGGHAGEGRAWHRGRDGRHARLVPADAGVDDRGANGLDRARLRDDVVPAVAAFHQVEHRQPVDQDEIGAAGLAHAAHDLHREAHAAGRVTAPGVGAPVGAWRSELVQQVAFRAHDLDAVVARVARPCRGGREGADLALDPAGAQRARGEGIDRRLQARRRDRQRVIGVTPRVQQLHADLAVVRVDRRGDRTVPADMPGLAHASGERLQPADDVGSEPAGHDQPDAACRTLRVVGGELREVASMVFQPGMHRPHQHPVAQAGESQVQGRQQARVGASHPVSIPRGTEQCIDRWLTSACGDRREPSAARMRALPFATPHPLC